MSITRKSTMEKNVCSVSSTQMELFFIAIEMKKAELADSLIVNAVRTALEFEGISDLLHLWSEENDQKEKDAIVADIQDLIDACS